MKAFGCYSDLIYYLEGVSFNDELQFPKDEYYLARMTICALMSPFRCIQEDL